MRRHGRALDANMTRRQAIAVAGAMGVVGLATARTVRVADATELAEEEAVATTAATGLADLPVVEFGSYPQTADGEVLPIEWYVLAEEEGRRLLLATRALDCHAYNVKFEGVTWRTCDLRFWLNGEFARTAFTEEERARIAYVELANADNAEYGVRGGGATRDHVFCLSLDEVARYLGAQTYGHDRVGEQYADLVVQATDYAKGRRINIDKADGGAVWWLRSPGDDACEAAYVFHDGSVDTFGDGVDYAYYGVRPAIWLDVENPDPASAEKPDCISFEDGGVALEAQTSGLGGPQPELDCVLRGVYRGALVNGADLTLWAQDGLGYYLEAQKVTIDFGKGVLGFSEELHGVVLPEFSQDAFALECQRIVCSFEPGLAALPLIEFGSYPQTAEGDVAPIEWRVLAEADGRQLLLAEHALDCVPYHAESADVTWETCDLRAWLNADFADAAFDGGERASIVPVRLDNPKNADRDVPGGESTDDLVFALSLGELLEHLSADTCKQLGRDYAYLIATPTDHAVANGAYANTKTGGARWWLRSPGDRPSFASCVSATGSVRSDGYNVEYDRITVRPALWVGAV